MAVVITDEAMAAFRAGYRACADQVEDGSYYHGSSGFERAAKQFQHQPTHIPDDAPENKPCWRTWDHAPHFWVAGTNHCPGRGNVPTELPQSGGGA